MSEKTKETKVVGSVLKAIDILELLARSESGLGVTEISQQLDNGISATYHLLNTLKLRNIIEQDERTKKYHIGFTLFRLSNLASSQNLLGNLSSAYLKQLSSTLDETSNLVILEGREIEYIAQSESTQLLKMFTRLGARVPFYCTGGGKVIFAYSPAEVQEKILSGLVFRPYTPNTLLTSQALLEEAERIRAQGYGLDAEEREAGVTCIAAPIFNSHGDITASITISGPTYRLREKNMDYLAGSVVRVAGEFSAALGCK